jgi:hypothetical protein
MSDDKVQIEEAAKSENNWVRARIFKQDLPQAKTLLQIAERARDMATNSLGTQHPAYAGALLNLGIYYDFIEHATVKAQDLFDQARAILERTQAGAALYAEALFELGTERKQRKLTTDDPRITEAYLNVHRRFSKKLLESDESRGSGPWIDRLDEACIYHSLDEETAAANPMETGWEERFASSLQNIADIITRHRDYLRDHKSADAWSCATPPQVCERLAAFAPTNPEWMRQLADTYDIIGNEQSGAHQIASFRAALFFRERLIALEQQHASSMRQIIERSANEKADEQALSVVESFAVHAAPRAPAKAGEAAKLTDTKQQVRARIEQSAKRENEWVRARIIKRERPDQITLLQMAERARDTVANSLGTQHPSYAVALQGMGFYYEIVKSDLVKANEFYERARNVAAVHLAEGLYVLGMFHLQTTNDFGRADAALTEALAIQRDTLKETDLPLLETLLALADAKAKQSDFVSALNLNQEILGIRTLWTIARGA